MAEKKERRERLIAERVRALAIVQITQREDLAVREVADDIGVDLMVRLLNREKPGVREFAVELRGDWSTVTREEVDAILLPTFRQHLATYGPWPYPVCLFYFTMEKTEGWVTWMVEPSTQDGKATLNICTEPQCQRLNDQALNEMVTQVEQWYDAYFATLIPATASNVPTTPAPRK